MLVDACQTTHCWSSISSPIRTNEEGCNLCGNDTPAVASRASASTSFRLAASRLAAIQNRRNLIRCHPARVQSIGPTFFGQFIRVWFRKVAFPATLYCLPLPDYAWVRLPFEIIADPLTLLCHPSRLMEVLQK